MSRERVYLPKEARAFLRTKESKRCRPHVIRLHRWMSKNDLQFGDLTPLHIENFWEHEQRRSLLTSTLLTYRRQQHKYLYWLHNNGHLRFVVEPLFRHFREPLPRLAWSFLRTRGNRQYEGDVRIFHSWLRRKKLTLSELTPAHIDACLRRPIDRKVSATLRTTRHIRLAHYLRWLHARGHVRFKDERAVRRPFPLPRIAEEFIDTFRPVKKPSTCAAYITSLRDLHAWLAEQKLLTDDFERRAAERWLKSLADRDLAPVTRNHLILHTRAYLRWLAERGNFYEDPDDLLRAMDLPKIPSSLPRPFPPEIDRELQRRLRQSDTVCGQALFLMRRSGMRIGELARLEPRCLDEDLHGHVFIKVPLGKLNNERLVPLDEETRRVTERLLDICDNDASFLIEPHLGRETLAKRLRKTLKEAASGLDIPGPVVTHRLRHTYATELLNAGMSLIGIMKLLGHRSLGMTMRYAAVTQETVVKDYFSAMTKISPQYELPNPIPVAMDDNPDPDRMLRDVISFLRNNAANHAQRLITRIHKIRYEIAHLEIDPSKH